MSQTVVHEYCPTGAADALFDMTHPEILIEGPAGTGKTRAIAEYIDSVCMENPGVRILVLRNVRADLAESVLVTFEKEVWWPGHATFCKWLVGNLGGTEQGFYVSWEDRKAVVMKKGIKGMPMGYGTSYYYSRIKEPLTLDFSKQP